MAEGFPVPDSSKEPEDDRAELPDAAVADAKEIVSELTALGSEFRRLLDPEVFANNAMPLMTALLE